MNLRKLKMRLAILAGIAALGFAGALHGAQRTLTIKEHLAFQWSGEFVSYPLEFKQGRCVGESVELNGPEGKTPVQVSGIELWPGSVYVKKANISFVVKELKPGQTLKYTMTYGPKPRSPEKNASDLQIQIKGGIIEAGTSRFAVRLIAGQKKYDPAIEAKDAPGPVIAMRRGKGTWFGGSRLYGGKKITGWSSELLENGPVFSRTKTEYHYEDGNTLFIYVRLIAGDYAMRIETEVRDTRQDCGWELQLNQGGALRDAVLLPGIGNYVKEYTNALKPSDSLPLCYLNPWPGDGWFKDSPSAIRLRFKNSQDEIQLAVADAGSWIKPNPRPEWADFQPWDWKDIPVMWAGWQNKRIPLFVNADGVVTMRIDLRNGQRKWMVGINRQDSRMLERYQGKYMSIYTALPRLNRIKDMVLEWKSTQQYPSLIMDAGEMQRAAKYNQAAFADATNVKQLQSQLATLGYVDLMRAPEPIAFRYDAVMGFGKLTDEEKALLKARMAYLGYLIKSPLHWSFERGCNSGNPNMTVARICNIGIFGCVLRDHPMGKVWAQYAVDWVQYWLANVTDQNGAWIESSHYARTACSYMVRFAIAARKAGYYDFFKEPKFKKMGMFYEKTLTPPDPLRLVNNPRLRGLHSYGVRVGAPYGRGTRGDAWEIGGLLAKATARSDPEYSRIMQWSWQQSGYVEWFGRKTGSQSSLYLNRDLPGRPPGWQSEFFPALGYLLRSQVGTPRENYLLFVSQYYRSADGEIWPSHTGSLVKWFAGGVPVGGAFSRLYNHSNVLLENRVMLACNWDPKQGVSPESGYVTQTSHEGFAPLRELDYVSTRFTVPEIKKHIMKINQKAPAFPHRKRTGQPPLVWQHQIMLMKPIQPEDISYLVMCDSILCDQPTQWHFWTLSEKLGTPDEVADRDVFLSDKPGNKIIPFRELKGDRFTAVGQFGMDLEYYIAGPERTPRYTLRYGGGHSAYGVGGYQEYQDLLHLQLPARGDYYVCMYPRQPARAMPHFSTLGKGTVIKIDGIPGKDYCFLSQARKRVSEEVVSFDGTAAAVQDRPDGLRLILAAAGEVNYRDYLLKAEHPVTLRINPYSLTLSSGVMEYAGGTITISAPGDWQLSSPGRGIALSRKGKLLLLTVPAEGLEVTLKRE